MPQHLAITVYLVDGRYHGVSEWPPSPARLFQALVAGAARGATIDDESGAVLEWLEGLPPPLIAAPRAHGGQRVVTFVPDNDIDAVEGDPARVDEIRSSKTITPRLLDSRTPFVFAWPLRDTDAVTSRADLLSAVAERLYQFGRGIDMAWAVAEVLEEHALRLRLERHRGVVYQPSTRGGRTLACPGPGSLRSLRGRYSGARERLKSKGPGSDRQLFSQPPKPRFAQVSYNSPPLQRVYELRESSATSEFNAQPLSRASVLVVSLRDAAAERLRDALPERAQDVERTLIGRKGDGSDADPTSERVRILPLPSIGHQHADHAIRRVLVEVPSGGPFRPEDMHWAFSGLEIAGDRSDGVTLVPSDDDGMLDHYGFTDGPGFRRWQTVTPAALPDLARRRRIDPAEKDAQAKGGEERSLENARAAGAVIQALRHAGVRTLVNTVSVQREPFSGRGSRVEAFADGTRFAKERLWHVEVAFEEPLTGPLVIGDGRFIGLGVMAPVRQRRGAHALVIEGGLEPNADTDGLTRALRRAIMARVQAVLGARATLPPFFTGHELNGSPAASEKSPHLFFAFDRPRARLIVFAPHVVEQREPFRDEVSHFDTLEAALADFTELRAARAGRLILRAQDTDIPHDPLLQPSRTWTTLTPYQVTRHAKHVGAVEAVGGDILAECRRRGLPRPEVTTSDVHGESGRGLMGHARLTFRVAVTGPILLGKNRHRGGGLFVASE